MFIIVHILIKKNSQKIGSENSWQLYPKKTQKTGLNYPWKLYPKEIICINCRLLSVKNLLFSVKKKNKKISIFRLLNLPISFYAKTE